MKILNKILKKSHIYLLAATCCMYSSCDFLDVVPPEQANLTDAVKDAEATLGFLFSCYAGVQNPLGYTRMEASADEYALPELWGHYANTAAYNLVTPQNAEHRWGTLYRFIGQTHLFLQNIEYAQGVTEEQRTEWIAEAHFLLAYYHFEVLRFYGPCPITDSYIDKETSSSQYHGRYHYDYVTEWIVKELDWAINNGLPKRLSGDNSERPDDSQYGRATVAIAKALKARVLLYAASDLWNGGFPFKTWKNDNFETPGYGKELVSHEYKREKWVKALTACEEALEEAEYANYKLLQYEDLSSAQKEMPETYIPGLDRTTDKGKAFAQKVLLMQYVIHNRESKEVLWGVDKQDDGNWNGCMPTRIVQMYNGTWWNGYSGMCPYLYTMEHFYTKNGKLPADDPEFYDETEWLKSAQLAGRESIIKLHLNREPRYYAWLAFDGGDYGVKFVNGKPLQGLELRNSMKQGYNPELFNRDHCVTGFLTQKFIQPGLNTTSSNTWDFDATKAARPLIRLSELYLNLAECQAELSNGNDDYATKAIENINIIRRRAGVGELEDLGNMPLIDWVRNERFIELWGEGHRYFDLRRWMIAPQHLAAGKREGLNAEMKLDPTFEEYNQRIKVAQPYEWENRMYIAPLFYNECYKNPQMVQAPGY